MTGLCIVDVCGTLVRDDTTLGLLVWHFRQSRRWRLWGLRLLASRRSPARLVIVVAERISGRHLLKHLLVGWLSGDRPEDLANSARAYAGWLLAQHRVPAVQGIIDRHGGPLVLASASLEPVVESLADALGARFVASTLEVQDGRYTGRYGQDLTGAKAQALQSKLGIGSLGESVVISDNLTDRGLMESAGKAYVVLHKPSHRQRWAGLDAEYLDAC